MNFIQSLNTLVQYGLPSHLLSRCIGQLAYCQIPQIKNFLIKQFIRQFDISMDELAEPSTNAYPHFNAFFTRALKPGVRPLAGMGYLASPVDGTIFSSDNIANGTRFEAKGHRFSLADLLGGNEYDGTYEDGKYLTIYLSPKDYHRVHCPIKAELKQLVHVPGRLFSVNNSTTTSIPAVFARNERVIMHFKDHHGAPFALILVGAMLVASIETPFTGIITPPGRAVTKWNYHQGPHQKFEQGSEIGRFQYGSTVIILLPKGAKGFSKKITSGQTVNMGESLGQF